MKKPATILTGFLGAGKTTYLNALIRKNTETRYAIVENEFGEQSIDGSVIVRAEGNIVEMNNGCLCCSLNDDLYRVLNDLYLRQDEFDELVIEATGVADPAGIAAPFLIYPAVRKAFELVNVICLIDAELLEDQLRQTVEARQQISFSDVLLINKTDLVSQEQTEHLTRVLEGINPFATVLIQRDGEFPVVPPKTRTENSCVRFQRPQQDQGNRGWKAQRDHGKTSVVNTHRHTDIVTHSFVFGQKFNFEALHRDLLVLLTFQAKDIYRFKAIVSVAHRPNKMLIQSVGKRLGVEELGPLHEEDEESRFVFIGRDIQPEGLRRLLERCAVSASPRF